MSAGRRVGDAELCACVRALWALIEAARGGDAAQREQVAARAEEAVTVARGGEGYLLLHEHEGALHVGGRRVPLGVDVFLAAQGLADLLRTREVGEVLVDREADAASLLAWAEIWAVGHGTDAAAPAASRGIHVGPRGGAGPDGAGRAAPGETASRLRSTFLQHLLIASFDVDSVLPPHVAKVTLGAVVDRMLALPGGTEPLTLLQRDAALLHRSLHVAAYGVVLARVLGWPEDRLADLGGAALLHDIGRVLDPARPTAAGFAWLLGRGVDPFWQRSAVVARTWRAEDAGVLAEVGAEAGLAALVVRLAADVEREVAGGVVGAALAQVLAAAAARGSYPAALTELAAATVESLRAAT